MILVRLANVFKFHVKEFRILTDKMRAFLVFTLSICVEVCCGRYFNRRVFEYKPGKLQRFTSKFAFLFSNFK